MRVTLVNQFYPPDLAPTGRLLEDVADELAARGHEVRVVCSRAAYGGGRVPEGGPPDGRVQVRRIPAFGVGGRLGAGRVAEHALYCAGLAADLLLSPKPELVLSLTTPPYVGVIARAAAFLRGSAHAHWVMDVYPDAAFAHGLVRRDGRAWRALVRLARWQWTGAAAVITLGPRMARLLERYADPGRTAWVALWPPIEAALSGDGAAAAMRARRGFAAGELVLLCSGHLGLGHRLDDFLEAAARFGAEGPAWAFAGSGPRASEVESFVRAHPAARVSLHPRVDAHELAASLASGDVHLVGVAPGWAGVMVPSRLQAAFAAGRPVLYVGPDECEVADWIRDSGGGWVAAPGDVAAVMAAVDEARDPAQRAARGDAARAYAGERFDRGRNRARVADLVEGAGLAPPPRKG